MDLIPTVLLKLTPKQRRIVAQTEHVVLEELVFSVDEARKDAANLLSVRHRSLLPSNRHSEYITVLDAHRETGIKERELRRLAHQGKLDAIKVGRTWLILRVSLHDFVRNQPKHH
jgi:excisionase family DNA binding protein